MKLIIDEVVQGETLEFKEKEDLLKKLNQIIDDCVIEVRILKRDDLHCLEGPSQCN